MKLAPIEPIHLYKAAEIIDKEGIPNDNLWNQYYVVVNKKEYPFKHIVRIAYKLATGNEIPLPFQSNKPYRKYIESKSFKINYYKDGKNFVDKNAQVTAKIARITWNENQWVKPSGRLGKSKNESYENRHGFGHEEWLFDGDKIIDDFKYGFLEPIHKYRSKYENHIYDISLFTHNNITQESFWVTTLKDVEVLTQEESKKILGVYKKRGWYEEMKNDIYDLYLNPDQLDIWIEKDPSLLFNIKFKASQISNIPSTLIPVSDKKDIPSMRYTLMNIPKSTQNKYNKLADSGFSFETGSKTTELTKKSKRVWERKEIELIHKHNELQTKFLKFLQNKYSKDEVKRECKAYGASRIDIVRKTKTGFIFYELKTYNNLKTSIRESLGQLFEYCFYPNVKEAQEIVLVSHIYPSEDLILYLNLLKKMISIPFSYMTFDLDKEEITFEV